MPRILTLPLRVTSTGMATIEQGHPAEIAQSLGLLLATRPGERRSSPEYGYPDPTFAGVDVGLLRAVAADWEPRAELDDVDLTTATISAAPGQSVTIHITDTAEANTDPTVQEA